MSFEAAVPPASLTATVSVAGTDFSLRSRLCAFLDSLTLTVLSPAAGSAPLAVPIATALRPSLALRATFAAIVSLTVNEHAAGQGLPTLPG